MKKQDMDTKERIFFIYFLLWILIIKGKIRKNWMLLWILIIKYKMGKTEYGHKIGNPYYILFKKEGIFFI